MDRTRGTSAYGAGRLRSRSGFGSGVAAGMARVEDKRHPFAGANRTGSTGVDLSRPCARHPVSVPQPSRWTAVNRKVTAPVEVAAEVRSPLTADARPHHRSGGAGHLQCLGPAQSSEAGTPTPRMMGASALAAGSAGAAGSGALAAWEWPFAGRRDVLMLLHGGLVGCALGPAGTAVTPRTALPGQVRGRSGVSSRAGAAAATELPGCRSRCLRRFRGDWRGLDRGGLPRRLPTGEPARPRWANASARRSSVSAG